MNVRNHWWWRPGWGPGRHLYTWHITFERIPAVPEYAEPFQRRLADRPDLDLVPGQWLHLTTQDIGFVDEVRTEQLAAIRAEAARLLTEQEPFTATVGAPEVWNESVVLAPRPVDRLTAVWEALRAAITAVLGAAGLPGAERTSFRPHVSIAYVNTDGPAAPITAVLAEESAKTPLTLGFRVERVSLLRQERVDHLYRWDLLDTVDLGG